MAAKVVRPGVGAARRALQGLRSLGAIRRRAALASLVWAVVVGGYAIGFFAASQERGTAFLDAAFFLVTLILPLILVWTSALLAEELARQRDMIAALAELAAPLARALEVTRASLEEHARAIPAEPRQAGREAGRDAAPAGALERLLAGQARTEAAVQALLREVGRPAPSASPAGPAAAPRTAPAAARAPRERSRASAEAAPPAAQPGLPLLAEPEPEDRLAWDELMRAFDFPRDAEDGEGFRALRLALRHRGLAQMLQAAEDVLTLLSQEGVYMDDLAMRPAEPQAWRRFTAGARGAEAAGVGGVRDAGALEAAQSLMKADPIFRDSALVFQRRFDAVLGQLADAASDDELAQLAGTRSGRAFQLMARASGSFD